MTFDRRMFLAGALALPCAPSAFANAAAGHSATLTAKPLQGGRLGYVGDGYDGVLRVRKGGELRVTLINRLDRPTSIHWRGVRGPNDMDGVAPLVQAPVAPGERFDYRFTPPDAGLFLFHAHAEPDFAGQVERGLAGVLLVEDPAEPPVDEDFIAALADAPPVEGSCEGGILHTAAEIVGAGRIGLALTVNGAPAPAVRAAPPGARVRVRLANLSTSRLAPLQVEGAQSYVVAVDGQPCAPFEPLRGIVPSAPGSRFDLMFDMPTREGAHVRLLLAGAPKGTMDEVLSFTAKGAAARARPPVASAPLNPLLPDVIPLQNARRMDLSIEVAAAPADTQACLRAPPAMWRINGKPGGATTPLFSVRRGAPVSLGFVNKSAAHIVMRLHGHVMRQLHLLDDGWDPYWRDAVVVPAGRTVRVAFIADNPGRWRLGAGVLPHALGGLAGVFEVT